MISSSLVLCVLFLFALSLYSVYLNVFWKRRNIPYLVKYPQAAIKDIVTLKLSISCFLQKVYYKTTEPLIGFHLLGKPGILLRDPSLLKQILIKDFNQFADKSAAVNYRDDPVGSRVLFLIRNPEWRKLRVQISPAFSTGKLKKQYPKMVHIGNNFVNYLQERSNETFSAKEVCGKYAVEVISSCGFGIDGNCFEDENALPMQAAKNIFVYNFYRGIQFSCYFNAPALVKLFRMTFLEPSSIKFICKMFDDIREARITSGQKYFDFADVFLRMWGQEHSSHDEVYGQVAQIWIAGFETVSSTIMFGLYEIANNKSVQHKLRDELLKAKEKYGGLTYESLNSIPYMEMVINEILRKYPSVPFADRQASQDYKIPGTDMIISKGTNIYISLLGLHYDPLLFPNPNKFDPERFSFENKHLIEPFSYLPFGVGPRNCIGFRFGKLSAMTAIASIISNFEVEPTPYPGITFDNKGFMLSPEVDIKLRFKKLLKI